MDLLDLLTELEMDIPVANIVSPLRLLAIGKYLELSAGQTVIDLGCGRGEMLCLWAKHFGISGLGIDRERDLLAEALSRASRWHVTDRLQFLCQDMQEFDPSGSRFDVAACMGATMGFSGYRSTLVRLKELLRPGGCIAISEPFYFAQQVPDELREYEGNYHTEPALFDIARDEGLEVGYYSRATRDEWDRYIFSSRKQEMQAFLAMAPGPKREKRRAALRRWQDMYLLYRQRWQGIAFLTLHSADG